MRILSNLQARKMDATDGLRWYQLIDWLMKLPAELNEAVYQQQREKGMKYISYAEQKGIEQGIEKGREKGREEGIEKGIEKGRLLGQIRLCQELLKQATTPEAELLAMPQEELSALLARLREQLSLNGQ